MSPPSAMTSPALAQPCTIRASSAPSTVRALAGGRDVTTQLSDGLLGPRVTTAYHVSNPPINESIHPSHQHYRWESCPSPPLAAQDTRVTALFAVMLSEARHLAGW